MAFTPHPILDLGVSTVGSSFSFNLLDRDLQNQGTLAVLDEVTPQIEHNVDRSVKRTLTGLRISPRETLAVNPLADRVQPVMTTADGLRWPLGVFTFSDFPGKRTSVGVTRDASLQDGGALLEAGTPRTIGLPAGSSVRAAIIAYLEEAGVTSYYLPDITNVTGGVRSWKPNTPWRTLINDLASATGLLSPSFDHNGTCHVVPPAPAVDAGQADTTVDGEQSRIIRGSIVEDDTTLTAPNRYIATDTSAGQAEVSGTYDVPDSAPWSIANRGLVITEPVDVQGLDSAAEAVTAARMAYLRSRRTESVSFSTPPDPRHDIWTIIGYRGAAWRENRWTLSCAAGASMTHEARRTYT